MKIELDFSGAEELKARFFEVAAGIRDFRGATWIRVRSAFFKATKEIFDSEGGAGSRGKWVELSSPYKEIKDKRFGPVPILQASGKLYRSLTSGSTDTFVNESATEMTIGSTLPYAGYHVTGTNAPATRKRAYSGSAVTGPHRGGMPERNPLAFTQRQEQAMLKPLVDRVKQIADNTKLAEKRGLT